MDRAESGRLSLVVLVVGATLALAAGGGWWVAAAPSTAPAATPAPYPIVSEPEEAIGDPEAMLPSFPNTLVRQVERMGPGQDWSARIVTEAGAGYLLQYVCLGPGALRLRIEGTTRGDELHEVDCGGSFSAIDFVADGASVLISVLRPESEPADVGVQVLAVR